MINIESFIHYLEEQFHYITGVPCSYFKAFLDNLANKKNNYNITHVYATREDEAIGIASGIAFSGKKAVVYMQNSGLGNIGDALTSLAQLYKLPMLILVSYRGLEPDKDFPEHSLMGDISENLLEAYCLPYYLLSLKDWRNDMKEAITKMSQTNLPVAMLVKKGVLSQ
ncbi:MAG: thiamine pyrophosphate-binding protein [Asgard group archaeon]|nr:thiamine pyrophosphate-binding protein [Asgard group archaeon]